MVGDVRDDVQPRERPRRRVLRELAQHEIEREEDRDLQHQRQAGRGRVDLVLPVELHQLFLLALLVGLVLLLDRLHLRHVRLHPLHRLDLPHRQRDKDDSDDDRQRHDGPGPRQADRPVQPVEHVPKQVLDRRERAEEDHAKSSWSWAWSTPPWLQGLQRSSRQPARTDPFRNPYSRKASSAYCEQDG